MKMLPAIEDLICRLLGRRCPRTVEFNGDSILAGYGVNPTPMQLIGEARPAWRIDDRAVPGLKLESLMQGYTEPYPGAPAEYYPRGPQPPFAEVERESKIVVLALGLNDAFNVVDVTAFEGYLRSAITILIAEHRVPVLTGLVGVDESAPIFDAEQISRIHAFNAITRALAVEFSLEHAGWDADYQGPQDVAPDHIHRTQAASDRLAPLLVAAIERAARR